MTQTSPPDRPGLNGYHDIHDVTANKLRLLTTRNRRDLGHHASCFPAVQAAKAYYSLVSGCRWCASAGHTSWQSSC
ncbi:hypothetical protein EUA93_16000 [Nocardioides oleivorans]|uniref:Uncharacterized protein n=1 Tax=Nocardioides oleivorans TaxID=273676 RepID=A0A4Q2RV07_9ACTN|nr:hypothetical protein EUA93_16000 [Nocardioides oleivorans]